MCDYSLHHVGSRPAKVGDKLFTTEFAKSTTRGFAAVGEYGAKLVIHDSSPKVAVCLLPGTELAFDDDVRYDRAFSFLGKARVNHKVARFREIEASDPRIHRDALEFPDGQVLKLARLASGQTATVLQLPVATHRPEHVEFLGRSFDSRVALDRVSPGMLAPNQGAVMLWETVRNSAIRLSMALVESFNRLKTPKQNPRLEDADMIEPSFMKDVLTVTLPKGPAAQKPGKKIDANAAA